MIEREGAERRFAQIEGERDYYKRLSGKRGEERDAAVEQVAYWRERAVGAEAEREALAAHVEMLHSFLMEAPIGNGVCCCGDSVAGHADPMSCGHEPVDEVEYAARLLIEQAPATSLAQLKAEWQADAISEWADKHLGGYEQELAEIYASKLRRQAEEA